MSGTQYLGMVNSVNIDFDEPISAFGAYVYQYAAGGWITPSIEDFLFDIEYASGEIRRLETKCAGDEGCYFYFIEKDSNKAIVSMTMVGTMSGNSLGCLDDMTVASDYQVKNMYHGVERELDENDPFLNSSTPWVDTDNDGVADNADKDDDNDGIPDTVERANRLNPLNAADAQGDLDGDGFSNVIEYQMGTNMKNARSKPVWAPVIMGDIMIFIPAKR